MRVFKTIALLSVSLIFAWGEQESSAQTINEWPKKGLTLETVSQNIDSSSALFTANCKNESGKLCDPYQGDMFCHVNLPILCFLDIDAPVPQTLKDDSHWSGGLLALTSPKKGNQFSRLPEVNNYCESVFGKGWRVASFHDAGGWQLKGYGAPPLEPTSTWIDIKDQPKATCWSR